MLNDVVPTNNNLENSNNELIINLLTDSDYFLDKTIHIQKLDKDKLGETGILNLLVQIPSFILKNSLDYCTKELGNDMEISNYFLIILKKYNKRFETQHLTTSSLVYDERKPRQDVLEKLETIGRTLEVYGDVSELSEFTLSCIIKSSLGNRDSRTLRKYLECIKYFVECKMGQKLGYNSKYNLEGFHEIVLKALDESQ